MWYRWFKISLLIGAVVLLSSCNKRSHYEYLLKNPQQVQTILSSCGTQQTQECVDARIAAQVFNEYVTISRTHQQQIQQDRVVILQLQQQNFQPKTPEQQRVLNQFESMQFAIDEEFGKKIIDAQARLVNMQTALQNATNPTDRSKLAAAVARQQQLVEAMQAMILVIEPMG